MSYKLPMQFEDFPKIDAHSHIFQDVPPFVEMMRRDKLQVLNICYHSVDKGYVEWLEGQLESLYRKYGNWFPFASSFDLSQRDVPDYAERTIEWIDRSVDAGAVMVKVWKDVGLEIKDPDGQYILPDDPRFDPIYAHLAARNVPLIIHAAEPLAAWLPLNPADSEDLYFRYYSAHPEWHFHGRNDIPSHETLIAARDHIMEKHPALTVIGAHLGSQDHNVDEVAARLDKYPNYFVDNAARTLGLTKQPAEKVRRFFERYQDRIIFGIDLESPNGGRATPDTFEPFTRVAEEHYRTDYAYYAGVGTVQYLGREIECLGLPVSILEKFYRENARRIIPRLSDCTV